MKKKESASLSRGLFIVFEGIDGSGTTTQCELLARNLEGWGCQVVRSREPGGTPLGEKIRHLVLDPTAKVGDMAEMLLYAASRAEHVREVIAPALHQGKTVVCDRFVASSLAYQGLGRDLGIETVWGVNQLAVGNCMPDLTVFLDIPLAEARRRRQQRGRRPDRLEREGDALQERVARGYREVTAENQEGTLVLDGTGAPENLAVQIENEIRARWPQFSAG